MQTHKSKAYILEKKNVDLCISYGCVNGGYILSSLQPP